MNKRDLPPFLSAKPSVGGGQVRPSCDLMVWECTSLLAMSQLFWNTCQLITEVIKAQLLIRHIRHIAAVGLALLS